MDDTEVLLARAQEGDGEAYGRLVARFQDMAVAYARSSLGDTHLAEDASQEAFVEAIIHLRCVHSAAAFPAWLRRIVFKHCDRIRRARRVEAELDSATEPIDPADDPLAAVETGESRREVHRALESLPADVRDVAHLYYLGSQSHNEIAEFLDVTPAVVNNRLYQARKRLREELMAMAMEELQSQRPSKDERFVEGVVKQAMTREEMAAFERLHAGFPVALGETLSRAAGRRVTVETAWCDQTFYELVVDASFYPVLSYRCALGSADEGLLLCLSTPAVRALLNGSEKKQDVAPSRLSADEVLAFQETANDVIQDLRNVWSGRDVGLRCLEVSNGSPTLTWSMEQGMASTGFARPESVVVIVGFQITVEGFECEVLNQGPERNPYGVALALCYNYEVTKANAL